MARHFLRLKLALLASSLRRGWQHALGFVMSVLFGLPAAFLVAAGLALASRTTAGPALLVLVYAGLVLAWTLAPVLFFGLDETLDPARLRLLPLGGRQLLTGLTVAAMVGVPAAGTLAVLAAGVAYAGGGPAGVAVAVLAALTQFVVCLWAGRALATVLSAVLRSRKGRDLAAAAAMLMGLLLAAAGQVPNLLANVLGDPAAGLGQVLDDVAGVVVLTPPGWAAGAVLAAGEGRVVAALGWLAGTVVLAAALAWAWQAALERTLSRPDTAPATEGRDEPLFPAWPGRLLPRRHLGAATAKELRYLVRVPQLRVGLGLLALLGAAIVVATALLDVLDRPEVVYAGALIAVVQSLQAVNLFGHDRGAVWLLVSSGSTYRADLAGKGLAHLLATMTVVVPLTMALAALTGAWSQALPAVLLTVALQASALGVGTVASVLAPYPMPEGAANVWGSSTGMGCATMLLQLVAFTGQGVLMAPAGVAVAAAHVLAPALLPVAAALAACYGVAVWAAGVALATARLDARGPEFVGALSVDAAR